MPQFKVGDIVSGVQRLGSSKPPYTMHYCPYIGRIVGKVPHMGWEIELISREVKPLQPWSGNTCEHDWNLKPGDMKTLATAGAIANQLTGN